MSLITFLAGVLILFIILKILALPMKLIIKFVINAVIGGIIIYGLSFLGIGIVINWITTLIVGFLGIPGVIIVAILQFVFHIF
ncbi:MAG: transcriptional regulator [Clostridia bacterium]|nr:transcriptional regulator [Clostridia bacterium]MCI9275905.1 transcriptional regulator [Clostridia bacterium]